MRAGRAAGSAPRSFHMNTFSRVLATAVIASLLAFCPNAVTQQAGGGGYAKEQAKELAKLLKKRGYFEVPLTLSKSGLLDVKVEVDGLPMLLILDSGANNVNLDRASAKRAKLAFTDVEEKTSALGGNIAASMAKIGRLAVGKVAGPGEIFVVDFSIVNAWRKERGDSPCDGILGGSFLKHYSAVIAYAPRRLYLLDAAQQAKSLAKRMKKDRYVEIPLVLNKNGLLDVKAEVNGVPMLLFLDTGSLATISLDRASVKRTEATVKENDGKRTALGGALAVGQTRIGRLSVGGLTSAADAEVVDFSPTNATRKTNGAPPCDGALGSRFLEHYAAVIDYAHLKLYLLSLAPIEPRP
jgi:predicted aspartyl protease